MENFFKATQARVRINLNHVALVDEHAWDNEGKDCLAVHLVGDLCQNLYGEDALRLLAILEPHQDCLEVCAFMHCQATPVQGSQYCATHAHLELGECPRPDCDFPARYEVRGQPSCWGHIPGNVPAGEIIDRLTRKPITA